jgi:hypothetical protein
MLDLTDSIVLAIQIGLGVFLFLAFSIFLSWRWGAPWVVTPKNKVHRMLDLAELRHGEKLVDLGAGDGRIVIAAARDFQAEAVGVEIDPVRWLLANLFIRMRRFPLRPKMVWGDMTKFDLSDADVVAVYLTRQTNDNLRDLFEDQLKLGARVVSYAFPVKDWTPTIIDDTNLIFVYQIGQTGEETSVKFV